MSPRFQRVFTRQEAETLLPEVDRLLARAQELAEEAAGLDRTALEGQWRLRSNGHARTGTGEDDRTRQRDSLARRLAAAVRIIQQLGVIVRDVRAGLIDFPSQQGGRTVFLCWRRGEPLTLQWWHETDVGFAGRQPLDT